VRKADNLTTFICRLYKNSGSLNLLEPCGPVQACIGTALRATVDLTIPVCNTVRYLTRVTPVSPYSPLIAVRTNPIPAQLTPYFPRPLAVIARKLDKMASLLRRWHGKWQTLFRRTARCVFQAAECFPSASLLQTFVQKISSSKGTEGRGRRSKQLLMTLMNLNDNTGSWKRKHWTSFYADFALEEALDLS
jgi:hypothetical protein